jgi:5-methyltetrahydrofolate--homocysteine methyltransferase
VSPPGAARPLLVGERLNPSGNPRLAQRLLAGDLGAIDEEVRAQTDAGADLLDVNGALEGHDESDLLAEMIRRAEAASALPLVIDAREPERLLAAAALARRLTIVSSITAEPATLERFLPLAAGAGLAVVGLAMAGGSVPPSPHARLACAERFVGAGRACGLRDEQLIVDCLAQPGGADPIGANAATFEAMRLVKAALGVPLILGISNVSYGARAAGAASAAARRAANAAFLRAALAAGLDYAIANPLDPAIRAEIAAARC